MKIIKPVEENVPHEIQEPKTIKVKKNTIVVHNSDFVGSGTIRSIWPFDYLASVYGKPGNLVPIITQMFIRQPDILARTRTVWFQRNMSTEHLSVIKEMRRIQPQLKYKLVYDLDDMIWGKNEENGGDKFHGIPSYNFAAQRVTEEMQENSREAMDYVDLVTVSTEYLKTFLQKEMKVTTPISVYPNSVPKFMFGGRTERPEEMTDIKKPRVLFNESPTHYSNVRKMKGDLDNAWCEWVLKAVKNDEIELFVQGGLPYVWEEVRNKVVIFEWQPAFNYPGLMRRINPHFVISPLVYNQFNSCKSDIKFIEACAIGAVDIGTVFSNGEISPYDNNIVKIKDTCTVEEIDSIFKKYCQKDEFNLAVQKGYNYLEENGRYTESKQFINLLLGLI